MRKSYPILLLLIVFSLFFTFFYAKMHNKYELPESTLLKAFNHSGAKVINSEIYFWARLDNKFGDFEEIKLLASDLAETLNIVNSDSFTNKTTISDLIQKVEMNGVVSDNRVVSINGQVSKKADSEDERFISVSINEDLPNPALEELRRNVVKVFKKYNINPKINSCIVGNYDGKLDRNQLNDIGVKIFKGAQAKKVEGIKDSRLISVSAYSPYIEDSINVNGKKVNLNLAIRYNSFENKTYIWLATPVITTEY